MHTEHNGMQFSRLFGPSEVLCQVESADRNEVILELLKKLAFEKGIGNVDHAYRAVLERENDIPSIIGPHIAMPHARLDAIEKITVGVATSKKGIAYIQPNDNPIKLMILILAPKMAPGAYLQAISSLAKICQDPSTADIVSELKSPKDVWQFFEGGGMVLPDHLLTRDIMDPVTVKLQEHDTLERAINLFIRHGRIDLPVVDKEDELIGVVTTYELLRVCMPDYILWMDDLTPILNFEPFAGVLRNESKTWLTEIMTSEFATVQAESPAIQVAKELTRYRADHAYVLQGKKLVGVISLESFLRKVLRE